LWSSKIIYTIQHFKDEKKNHVLNPEEKHLFKTENYDHKKVIKFKVILKAVLKYDAKSE